MKYSNDDIIEALRCCSLNGRNSCETCPLKEECEESPLESVLAKYTLGFIDDLILKNKKLTEELYKEMSERMKEEVRIAKKYTAKYIRNGIKETMFSPNNKFDFIYDEIFSVIDKVLEECDGEKDT
jgi:hypothetical protein